MQPNLNHTESWGQKLFVMRSFTPLPIIIFLLYVATPTVLSATLGMLVIVLGELIRIYSVAFIGRISRTRKGSLGNELVNTGPFKIVRNPLYVGNFLIANGLAIFSGQLSVVLLCSLAFMVQYSFIVSFEERLLLDKFGQQFEDYRRETPAWLPKKLPTLANMEWPSEFSMSLESEKRTLTSILILLLALAYSA